MARASPAGSILPIVHDFLIENAVVVDGLGTPARPGSIAIKEGRIAVVGGGGAEAFRPANRRW
jgi:N-acyl-D-aspartate/D-glutamate deacylase